MFHKPPKNNLTKIVARRTRYNAIERLLELLEKIAVESRDKITVNWVESIIIL